MTTTANVNIDTTVIWPEMEAAMDYQFEHAIVVRRFADGTVELRQKTETVSVPHYALKELIATLRAAQKANAAKEPA